MAALLTSLAWLLLGVAIGLLLIRLRRPRETPAPPVPLISKEWAEHCEAHAKAQAGSVVWTAPEVLESPWAHPVSIATRTPETYSFESIEPSEEKVRRDTEAYNARIEYPKRGTPPHSQADEIVRLLRAAAEK